MQSHFFRYHFGLECEERKIVRRVHAKRILQTAPHKTVSKFSRILRFRIFLNRSSGYYFLFSIVQFLIEGGLNFLFERFRLSFGV